jgi:hypothetical protein
MDVIRGRMLTIANWKEENIRYAEAMWFFREGSYHDVELGNSGMNQHCSHDGSC